LIVGVVSVFASSAVAEAAETGKDRVKVVNDEFTGKCYVKGTFSIARQDKYGSVFQKVRLFSLCNPKSPVGMTFDSGSPDGWQYLKCHSVAALADKDRIAFIGEPKHDGETQSFPAGSVTESVSVQLLLEELLKLGTATNSRIRICNDEFTIRDDDDDDKGTIKAFVEAVRAMPDPPKPEPAKTPTKSKKAGSK
jgi:hypothetical protein